MKRAYKHQYASIDGRFFIVLGAALIRLPFVIPGNAVKSSV